MKLAHRSALLCLLGACLPQLVACGSTDSLGLFSSSAGATSTNVGGSVAQSGGAANAGQGGGPSPGGVSSQGGGTLLAGQSAGGNAASGGGAGESAAGGVSAGKGGTAGSGVAGAGGAGKGGSGAKAGSGGDSAGGSSAGAGGSAGDASGSGCALVAPVDNVVCLKPTPNGCFYPGVDCDCQTQTGGGSALTRRWMCIGSRSPLCPRDLPATGDPCNGHKGADLCPYSSMDVCTCTGDASWDCSADKHFNCPAQAPNAGSDCGTEAICQYPGNDCLCNGVKWTCLGG